MKNCPYCAEEIQDAAIKCKHCGEFLNKTTPSPLAKTKNLFDQGISFIKEKNEERLNKKYSHLQVPTSDVPMVINDIEIYDTYIKDKDGTYLFENLWFIYFEEHSERTNGVKTKETVNFKLTFNDGNKNLEEEQNFLIFDLSYMPVLAMARSK